MTSHVRKLLNERKEALARGEKPRIQSPEERRTETLKQYAGEKERALSACKLLGTERGVVYFVRCGDFVKIGRTTKRVAGRMSSLQTGSPYEHEMLATVKGRGDLERELHAIFRAYQHRNEWFRYEGELQKFVEDVASNGEKFLPVKKGKAKTAVESLWRLYIPAHENFESLSLLTEVSR